jgi:hypothetical protein
MEGYVFHITRGIGDSTLLVGAPENGTGAKGESVPTDRMAGGWAISIV